MRSARTRRTILDGAAGLLAKDAGASLAELAAAAGVSRTTVHRHFPAREDLLRALAIDAIDRLSAAIAACRPEEGSAPDALARIAEAVVPMAGEFRFLESGPELWDLPELGARWYSMTAVIEDVVERGKRDGTLRVDLPTAWVADLFSVALWQAGESVTDGRIARRDAPALVVDVLLHGAVPGAGTGDGTPGPGERDR